MIKKKLFSNLLVSVWRLLYLDVRRAIASLCRVNGLPQNFVFPIEHALLVNVLASETQMACRAVFNTEFYSAEDGIHSKSFKSFDMLQECIETLYLLCQSMSLFKFV